MSLNRFSYSEKSLKNGFVKATLASALLSNLTEVRAVAIDNLLADAMHGGELA